MKVDWCGNLKPPAHKQSEAGEVYLRKNHISNAQNIYLFLSFYIIQTFHDYTSTATILKPLVIHVNVLWPIKLAKPCFRFRAFWEQFKTLRSLKFCDVPQVVPKQLVVAACNLLLVDKWNSRSRGGSSRPVWVLGWIICVNSHPYEWQDPWFSPSQYCTVARQMDDKMPNLLMLQK